MRKYLKYKVLGLAFIVIGMVACDQASQEPEPIVPPVGYPVPTYVNATGTTVVEGNSIIYNITIDQMIDRALTFSLRQTGGTATEEDYSAASAVIAPYTKSTQLVIETFEDYDTDASETIIGEIGVFGIADRYLLDPTVTNPQVTFTITNFVSPDLEVAFTWGGEVVIGEETYDAAEDIDFDFFIADAEGFNPDDVWATYIDYIAATGSNPETFTFENWPDGSYMLVADLWYNDFAGYGTNVPIPISAFFTRQGTTLIDLEVKQSEEDAMSSDQLGYDNDPSTDFQMVIAKVTIAGDKYTIFDAKDTNLGTYKKSGAGKTPRPVGYRK